MQIKIVKETFGYYIQVPVIKGCYTQAEKLEEIFPLINDLLKLHLEETLKSICQDETELNITTKKPKKIKKGLKDISALKNGEEYTMDVTLYLCLEKE